MKILPEPKKNLHKRLFYHLRKKVCLIVFFSLPSARRRFYMTLMQFEWVLSRKYGFQFTTSLSAASLNPFFSGWIAIWIINEKFCTYKLHAKSMHWYLSSAKFDSGMLVNSSWDRQCNDFLNHCCCYLIPMCFICANNKNLCWNSGLYEYFSTYIQIYHWYNLALPISPQIL